MPKYHRRWKLQNYLVFWSVMTFLVLVPLITYSVYTVIKQSSQDLFLKNANITFQTFVELLDGSEILDDQNRMLDFLDNAVFIGDVVYAEIIINSKSILSPLVDDSLSNAYKEDTTFGEGEDSIYFISTTLHHPKSNAAIKLRFGFDESFVETSISTALNRTEILFIIYAITTLVMLAKIAKNVTQPIDNLRNITQHLSSGKIREPISFDSKFQEVHSLGDDLEKMRKELSRYTRILEKTSQRDDLTQLPNRMVFNRKLVEIIEESSASTASFSLLVMDLNHFKEINDAMGHQAGDMLLQKLSLRMLGSVRGTDVVARLAGDEFAILLHESTGKDVDSICEKIIGVVNAPFQIEGQVVHVGISIGVAFYPLHGTTPKELLRKADTAMYHAKRYNMGFCIYTQQHDKNVSEQIRLRSDFMGAMPNDEIKVFYQCKVDLKRSELSGFEALVRWQHPNNGLIPPIDFLEIAEQTGLMNELTFYVLRQAAKDTLAWRNMGYDINIAINITPKNLMRPKFDQEVINILQEIGLSPKHVELELTEDDILDEPEQAIKILESLRDQGITIVVDDYGTGYSSLSYLKKLPISSLKIDRSFVMELDKDNTEIIKASIQMAHNIGLKVVAEGIETNEALSFLSNLGCDWGQGYYLSRPIPAEDILPLLDSYENSSNSMKKHLP